MLSVRVKWWELISNSSCLLSDCLGGVGRGACMAPTTDVIGAFNRPITYGAGLTSGVYPRTWRVQHRAAWG